MADDNYRPLTDQSDHPKSTDARDSMSWKVFVSPNSDHSKVQKIAFIIFYIVTIGCFIVCNLSMSSYLSPPAILNVSHGTWIMLIAFVAFLFDVLMIAIAIANINYSSLIKLPWYILSTSCILTIQGIAWISAEDDNGTIITINANIDGISFNLITTMSWAATLLLVLELFTAIFCSYQVRRFFHDRFLILSLIQSCIAIYLLSRLDSLWIEIIGITFEIILITMIVFGIFLPDIKLKCLGIKCCGTTPPGIDSSQAVTHFDEVNTANKGKGKFQKQIKTMNLSKYEPSTFDDIETQSLIPHKLTDTIIPKHDVKQCSDNDANYYHILYNLAALNSKIVSEMTQKNMITILNCGHRGNSTGNKSELVESKEQDPDRLCLVITPCHRKGKNLMIEKKLFTNEDLDGVDKIVKLIVGFTDNAEFCKKENIEIVFMTKPRKTKPNLLSSRDMDPMQKLIIMNIVDRTSGPHSSQQRQQKDVLTMTQRIVSTPLVHDYANIKSIENEQQIIRNDNNIKLFGKGDTLNYCGKTKWKWGHVKVFTRKKVNKGNIRCELTITVQYLRDKLSEHNMEDIPLIPIVMFDKNDQCRNEWIGIFEIDSVFVFVSMAVIEDSNHVEIRGIHLDMDRIQRHHELSSCHYGNDCKYCDILKEYKCNIDIIRIEKLNEVEKRKESTSELTQNIEDQKRRISSLESEIEQMRLENETLSKEIQEMIKIYQRQQQVTAGQPPHPSIFAVQRQQQAQAPLNYNYNQPTSVNNISRRPCKFGRNCNRWRCKFSH